MSKSIPPEAGARHRVERRRRRAEYDRRTVHAIIDAGMLAHVAFSDRAQPFVIPMLHARDGNDLLLHGSIAALLERVDALR